MLAAACRDEIPVQSINEALGKMGAEIINHDGLKPGLVSSKERKRAKMYICAEETVDTGLTEADRKTATEKNASVSDYRYPLFLGDWKRSIPYKDEGFANDNMDEPHVKRRITILQSHPEIESLYGYDPKSQYITLLSVGIQVTLAFLFGRVFTENTFLNWFCFTVTAYVVGASLTQILGIILHECTHALVAESLIANKIYGLIANIGIPFPIAMSFRRYHLDHHAYQGLILI